jgi:hypothetical protein
MPSAAAAAAAVADATAAASDDKTYMHGWSNPFELSWASNALGSNATVWQKVMTDYSTEITLLSFGVVVMLFGCLQLFWERVVLAKVDTEERKKQ